MHEIYVVLLDDPVYGLLHSKFWKQKMYLHLFLKVIIFGLLLSWRRHSSSSNIIFYFDSICWNCETLNWSLFLLYDEENWLWAVVPQKSIYITITLYWYNLHREYSVFNLFFSSVLRSSVKEKYVQRFISRAENTLLTIVFFLLWKHGVTLWGNKVCDPYQMLDMIFLANEIFQN